MKLGGKFLSLIIDRAESGSRPRTPHAVNRSLLTLCLLSRRQGKAKGRTRLAQERTPCGVCRFGYICQALWLGSNEMRILLLAKGVSKYIKMKRGATP